MKFLISCGTAIWVLLAAPSVWAQPEPGDYSPAKYEVIEELDGTAPVRDGVELMLDVFRPKDDARFPAILQQTPYDKSPQAARAKRFAARGYAVINVDSRGRFRSGGDWDPFSPPHKTDGYEKD